MATLDLKDRNRENAEVAAPPRFHGLNFGPPIHLPTGVFTPPGRFGRLFPHLPAFSAPDAALAALGDAMLEDAAATDAQLSNPGLPSGFTYLGQFIDHDITFDTTPMPERTVDPGQVHNFRTPALDLDSVYGNGPTAQPFLYSRTDPRLLLVGTNSKSTEQAGRAGEVPSLPNDLPRNAEGFALLGDPRNDENLLVAQTHVAFLKFHNKIVQTRNVSFEEARRIVTWHYQWIVLHDFLERIAGADVVNGVLTKGRKFYRFAKDPYIPIEHSVAAYRFGHSMVRPIYDHNRIFGHGGAGNQLADGTLELVFRFSGLSGNLTPTQVVPSDWVIDWRRFYDKLPKPPGGATVNLSRRIDPFLAKPLHTLPNGGGNLATRNLQRGVRMQLPSGQAVAWALGIPILTAAEIGQGPDGAVAKAQGLVAKTPLWYYILKESQLKTEGLRLGPVAARIVTEVFIGLLEGDPTSFLSQHRDWKPELPGTSGASGSFGMADLLTFVDDLNPIKD